MPIASRPSSRIDPALFSTVEKRHVRRPRLIEIRNIAGGYPAVIWTNKGVNRRRDRIGKRSHTERLIKSSDTIVSV